MQQVTQMATQSLEQTASEDALKAKLAELHAAQTHSEIHALDSSVLRTVPSQDEFSEWQARLFLLSLELDADQPHYRACFDAMKALQKMSCLLYDIRAPVIEGQ